MRGADIDKPGHYWYQPESGRAIVVNVQNLEVSGGMIFLHMNIGLSWFPIFPEAHMIGPIKVPKGMRP